MGKLIVTVVPPRPNKEAEAQFRQWVADHADLIATLDHEPITLLHIRGCDADGKIVGMRRYQVEIDEAHAHLLQSEDNRILEVIVVDSMNPSDAEGLFSAWWARHPRLREHLGEDGFIVDEHSITESGEPVRRYRVMVPESHASLLVPTYE